MKNLEKKVIDKPKPAEKPEPDFNLATMLKDLRNEDIANTIEDNEDNETREDKRKAAESPGTSPGFKPLHKKEKASGIPTGSLSKKGPK